MLSQKAKYALKAMLALAGHDRGELLQAADIAAEKHIPRKFLELILLDLRKSGLIHSQRGKHGGYVLTKPADTITFGEIVRIIDGPIALIPCASLTGYRRCVDCEDEKSCAVRRTMREVRDAAASILDRMTLAQASVPGSVDAMMLG